MKGDMIVTGFADEVHVRTVIAVIQARRWKVTDVYSPYALHGIDELLGLRRSRLHIRQRCRRTRNLSPPQTICPCRRGFRSDPGASGSGPGPGMCERERAVDR